MVSADGGVSDDEVVVLHGADGDSGLVEAEVVPSLSAFRLIGFECELAPAQVKRFGSPVEVCDFGGWDEVFKIAVAAHCPSWPEAPLTQSAGDFIFECDEDDEGQPEECIISQMK